MIEIDKILCMHIFSDRDLTGGELLTPEQQEAKDKGELFVREIILERGGKSSIVVGGEIITLQQWNDLKKRQAKALESKN